MLLVLWVGREGRGAVFSWYHGGFRRQEDTPEVVVKGGFFGSGLWLASLQCKQLNQRKVWM